MQYNDQDPVIDLLSKLIICVREDAQMDDEKLDEAERLVERLTAERQSDLDSRAKYEAELRARVGKFYKTRDYSDDLSSFSFAREKPVREAFIYTAITGYAKEEAQFGSLSGWSFVRTPRGTVTIRPAEFAQSLMDEISESEFREAAREVLQLVKPLLSGALPF